MHQPVNRHVNAISGCLSLRPTQRRSLEILHRITEMVPPGKDSDTASQLAAIRDEFPMVSDFEHDFPCSVACRGIRKAFVRGGRVCAGDCF